MKRLNFGLPLLLTAALYGAMTPHARSQETTAATNTSALSIDALVAEAMEKNPELKFYENELVAAKAGRKTAGLLPNPELGGSVGQKTIRTSGHDDDGVAWSVSLMQPFEWPGRLGLRKAIANHDIELATLGLQRFKAALAARVRLVGCELFVAQEKAAAARQVADRFQSLRETLVQRDPAGLTPLLETRVIEATELAAQREATEAELAARFALLELNQLRGVSLESRTSILPVRIEFSPAAPVDNLLAAAQTNNYELRLRATDLARQGLNVDLARNERFPAISIGPSFSEEKAGDRERIIGVGISLPLPLWNRNSDNIEAARSRRIQAETSLAVMQRDIERQVLRASHAYETKRREMEQWRPDSVTHFKDAAEVADRHYRLGAVTLSTYVELQEKYLAAVNSLLDTKREALEAAAQLELLTGLPLPLASTSPKEEQK